MNFKSLGIESRGSLLNIDSFKWRDIKSADVLDAFVNKLDFNKFDEVYANGDKHLDKVKLIKQALKRLMFNE